VSEFLVKIGPTPEILDSGNPPKIPKNGGGRGPPENPEKWGGTPPEFPGGTPPKNLQKSPKIVKKWSKMVIFGQKRPKNDHFLTSRGTSGNGGPRASRAGAAHPPFF